MPDHTPARPRNPRPRSALFIELVAYANYATYEPGSPLTAAQQRMLPDAIEVCRLSGVPDEKLGLYILAYEHHYGAEWRMHFWRHRLRRAAAKTDAGCSESGSSALPATQLPPLVVSASVPAGDDVAGSGARSPNR